jgi:hypothetical protein
MEWLAQRIKAVIGTAVPALVTGAIKWVESQFGIDIPTETEVAILSFVTGFLVYAVPNKPA